MIKKQPPYELIVTHLKSCFGSPPGLQGWEPLLLIIEIGRNFIILLFRFWSVWNLRLECNDLTKNSFDLPFQKKQNLIQQKSLFFPLSLSILWKILNLSNSFLVGNRNFKAHLIQFDNEKKTFFQERNNFWVSPEKVSLN